MQRWRSGQTHWTVNPTPSGYTGSNPVLCIYLNLLIIIMSEAFGVVFFVLSALLSLLGVVGVVYFIFFLVRNKDKDIKITTDTLLKVYLYLITFVTLFVAVGGATVFLNSAFSYKFGIPFSFKLEKTNQYYDKSLSEPSKPDYMGPECYMGNPTVIEDQTVCFDKEAQKQGLINGLTIAISMILLFVMHRVGIFFAEKKKIMYWLKKTYTFTSLIVFSVVGVVTIPIAAYQLATFLFSRPEDITMINPPGIAVATVIFVLPLWIYFLISTIKLKEEN